MQRHRLCFQSFLIKRGAEACCLFRGSLAPQQRRSIALRQAATEQLTDFSVPAQHVPASFEARRWRLDRRHRTRSGCCCSSMQLLFCAAEVASIFGLRTGGELRASCCTNMRSTREITGLFEVGSAADAGAGTGWRCAGRKHCEAACQPADKQPDAIHGS